MSTWSGVEIAGFIPGSTAVGAGGSSIVLGVETAGELAAGREIVSGAKELEADLATLATAAISTGADGDVAAGSSYSSSSSPSSDSDSDSEDVSKELVSETSAISSS